MLSIDDILTDELEVYIPPASHAMYPVRDGNRVVPLIDGLPAFERISAAVATAAHRVWVTIAFLDQDFRMPDSDEHLFDVLDRAATRGVDVRVIFWRSPILETYQPDTHFPGTTAQREWLAQRGTKFLARWDVLPKTYCHHQKSWIIDAGSATEVAFVGGINLDVASVSPPGHPPRPQGNTHDVYVEIAGPAATDIHHNFVQRWNETSERNRPDGAWPHRDATGPLPFPVALSKPMGDVPAQVTRTIRRGVYSDETASIDGHTFPIAAGEKSVLQQYILAIDAARDALYIENQYLVSPEIVERINAALDRGVEVVTVVPRRSEPRVIVARSDPRSWALFEHVSALSFYENFTMAGLASNDGLGQYSDIYVHSKVMIVDDLWATIGSTNIANQSLHADTEMNVSFWDPATVRAFRTALFQEHLGTSIAIADLPARAAIQYFQDVAHSNMQRRLNGEPLEGLACAFDPADYGSSF